jgi:hypothetical protein
MRRTRDSLARSFFPPDRVDAAPLMSLRPERNTIYGLFVLPRNVDAVVWEVLQDAVRSNGEVQRPLFVFNQTFKVSSIAIGAAFDKGQLDKGRRLRCLCGEQREQNIEGVRADWVWRDRHAVLRGFRGEGPRDEL